MKARQDKVQSGLTCLHNRIPFMKSKVQSELTCLHNQIPFMKSSEPQIKTQEQHT